MKPPKGTRLLLAVVIVFLFSSVVLPAAELEQAPTPKSFKYKKKKLIISKTTILVEMADTDELREHGLMGRTKLSDSEGMLFIFQTPQFLNFWMKNTLIPLDIGYIDKRGQLFQITTMEPASPMDVSPQVYPSKKEALYALEVTKGWFARKKIKVGSKIKPPS